MQRPWLTGVVVMSAVVGSCAELRRAEVDAGSPASDDAGDADVAHDAGGGDTDAAPCTTPAPDDRENCGRCGHSCGGGACKAGVCLPLVLAADRRAPTDIAVKGAFVYWVEQGTPQLGGTDGRLARASVTACDAGATCAHDLVDAGTNFAGLAVDTEHIYIAQGSLATGQVQRLAFAGGELTPFAIPEPGARRIALDAVAAYWVNAGSSPGDGSIRRKFLDSTAGGVSIASNLDYPAAVAVLKGRVFFSVRGRTDLDGAIHACDVTGASPLVVARAQAQPRGVALDVNHVYWVNRGDGTVNRSGWTGEDAVTLVPNGIAPNAIAVDADGLYWTEAGTDPDRLDGRVRYAKLDGTGVLTLASAVPEPLAIALDGAAVYVAVRGTMALAYRDGRILKIAKP